MTDSMCGPSNALQTLSKHTTTDHSLQRDRLRQAPGGPSSLGQFRSQTPHSSAADAEFSRFSGQPPPSLLHQAPHPFAADPLLRTGTPTFTSRAPLHDNWATDFQNLEISGPPSLHHHHQHQQALRSTKSAFFPQASSTSAHQWRQEFSTNPAPQQAAAPLTMSQYGMTGPSYSTFSPMYQTSTPMATATQSAATAQQDDFQFDESAFESAFEMAAQNLAGAEPMFTPAEESRVVEVPEEVVQEEEQKEEEKRRNDADDLARTAGQLLESVKGDTSEKFQKSSFMALMKKLRDREAMIEGDNIVEKGQQ